MGLDSKHLLGTVLLWVFCTERAVRRETSDLCGTSCCQSWQGLAVQPSQLWPLFLKFCFPGVGRRAGGMVTSNFWKVTQTWGWEMGKGCIKFGLEDYLLVCLWSPLCQVNRTEADFWQFYFQRISMICRPKSFCFLCFFVLFLTEYGPFLFFLVFFDRFRGVSVSRKWETVVFLFN